MSSENLISTTSLHKFSQPEKLDCLILTTLQVLWAPSFTWNHLHVFNRNELFLKVVKCVNIKKAVRTWKKLILTSICWSCNSYLSGWELSTVSLHNIPCHRRLQISKPKWRKIPFSLLFWRFKKANSRSNFALFSQKKFQPLLLLKRVAGRNQVGTIHFQIEEAWQIGRFFCLNRLKSCGETSQVKSCRDKL